MSKKQTETPILADEMLGKSEAFVLKYKNVITGAILALILIVGGIMAYSNYVVKPKNAEADKAMREELEALRKEKSISDYTNRCVTLGFEAELAAETAHALADGNMETMFDCLKQFVETTKTKLANDALNRQPSLSAGTPPTSNTVDTETEQLRRWMGAPTYRK